MACAAASSRGNYSSGGPTASWQTCSCRRLRGSAAALMTICFLARIKLFLPAGLQANKLARSPALHHAFRESLPLQMVDDHGVVAMLPCLCAGAWSFQRLAGMQFAEHMPKTQRCIAHARRSCTALSPQGITAGQLADGQGCGSNAFLAVRSLFGLVGIKAAELMPRGLHR